MEMEMDVQFSLDKLLGYYQSLSSVAIARKKGVELLNEKVLRKLKEAWGNENMIYTCKLPVYMLVGKVSL